MKEKLLSLTKKDFRIDWFSGTGGGGQYRNKHQNCCRITHLESGLVATGQSNRERPANQKEAFEALVTKVIDYYGLREKPKYAEKSDDEVRIYHEPDNVVRDKASKTSSTYVHTVEKANIDEHLENRKKALMSQDKKYDDFA